MKLEYTVRLKRPHPVADNFSWIIRIAFRDARKNYSRLILFASALITGVAAMVSIGSLNESLQNDLDRNARELLGSDLAANSGRKFDPAAISLFDSIKVPQSRSADMASMVLFKNSGQSRLIKLNALEKGFPYYGEVETVPADVWNSLQFGGQALLDEPLAVQYEVSTGDTIKVGSMSFRVAGYVRKFPGGSGILQTFTPSVYIGYADLDSTGLVQFGSRISYHRYFKETESIKAAALEINLKSAAKKYEFNTETVESRKENLGEAFRSVYRFFSMLGFVALILGCIGVASSVSIYAREKKAQVAVLRCLGASGWQAFTIYLIQIFFVGVMATLTGVGIGIILQQSIPYLFGDFIPGDVQFTLGWRSALEGLLTGTIVSILFAALPLLSVRFIPPLAVLRSEVISLQSFSRSRILLWTMALAFPLLMAVRQTGSWLKGLGFAGGLAVALLVLWLTAEGLLRLVRKFFPARASFIYRYALSGLYRPGNQTRLLMVTIGLGAFILSTLNVVQSSLLGQVEFTGSTNQSNTILFDIQSPQRDGVAELIKNNSMQVNQLVPIVTCRLAAVKNRTVDGLRKDSTVRIPEWALTREYRVTYRDSLKVGEELTSGKLQHLEFGKKDSVFVTISEGFQETLRVNIGDSLLFDVQGLPVRAIISGIRKVDWPKDPPNFIFVFPDSIISEAPQIWVASTRVPDEQRGAKFQRELLAAFPNVSLIDLRLVLSTINSIFEKVELVVRFLALFSIITGLIVLAGAVLNSRYARMTENVLLRTIGARSKQIISITLLEYLWLGLFATFTGMILSVAGGWALCTFFLEVKFSANFISLGLMTIVLTVLTVLIGWWNSRSVLDAPPLTVLRREN